MKPCVKVLMSTYNGEKYLKEQLESLLNQDNVSVDIDIRDDGSSDGTVTLLKKYEEQNSNIHVKYGENIGPSSSFIDLLYSTTDDFDYYAFSDQDDVWYKDKLISAIKKITENIGNNVGMYYSSLMTFDTNRGIQRLRKNRREYSFLETFIQSHYPGCTIVFNKKAFEEIRRISRPRITVMHDLFIVQVLMGLNKPIIYDEESHINYRIHGGNVSVRAGNFIGEIRHILKIVRTQKGLRLNSAINYYEIMGKYLNNDYKYILKTITCYRSSWKKKKALLKLIKNTRFSWKIKLIYFVAIISNVY